MVSSRFGKYQLIAELGHGGMADVFLAAVGGPAGMGFSKLVVIKRLRPNLAEDPEFIAMLIDEARIAARLNHPNVVQTIEVGEADKQYFVAMEFLQGQPLHNVLKRAERAGTKLPQVLHYQILADVLSGLHYAHELTDYDGQSLQIVHRDVTPQNVFVTYDGQVKVMDFGIAKASGRTSETRTGIIKGKVTYMSPEQASCGDVDRRADLFSVGVMLWEAAVGARMWKGVQDVVIMDRLIKGEMPPSARAANARVPEEIDRICQRALAWDPERRYETAAEFEADLERYLAELAAADGPASAASNYRTNREAGKFISTLFEDRRIRLKEIIERQLKDASMHSTGDIRLPLQTEALSGMGSSSSPHSTRTPAIPSSRTPAAVVVLGRDAPKPELAETDKTSATLVTSSVSRSSSSKGKWIVGLVVLGGGAVFAITRPMHREDVALPPPEVAASIREQAPPPPPEPRVVDVTLTIRASPSGARLTIDDHQQVDNPFIGRFPKDDREHTLRVEADGYRPVTKQFKLDDDAMLDVALDPDKDRHQAPRAAAAPPPPPAPGLADPKPATRPKRDIDTTDPWEK